ncbi:MAG TPA: hypothetical protein VK192_02075, partial [Sphingomicrobium sp.]|nr:hypothetical protein [Sphingomicrobium sp.]
MDVALDAKQRLDADIHLAHAKEQVERTLRGEIRAPVVRSFFDEPTFTATHVVHDPVTKKAAIVDSVMDFDQAAGHT